MVQRLTVARVAEGLGVSWDTANNAVLAAGTRVLIDDPARFDGVKVIGVDEHVWGHTRQGEKYVGSTPPGGPCTPAPTSTPPSGSSASRAGSRPA